MSHVRRADSSSSSSSYKNPKQHQRQVDEESNHDNTTTYFGTSGGKPVYNEEPRDKNMDSNFQKNPCLTWIKMLFPHFKIASISVGFAVFLILVFLIELLFWINNAWS